MPQQMGRPYVGCACQFPCYFVVNVHNQFPPEGQALDFCCVFVHTRHIVGILDVLVHWCMSAYKVNFVAIPWATKVFYS